MKSASRGARGPDLLAGHPEVVAVAHGPGADAGDVRPGVGLAHPDGPRGACRRGCRAGRRACCSAVPNWRSVGPIWRSANHDAATGAPGGDELLDTSEPLDRRPTAAARPRPARSCPASRACPSSIENVGSWPTIQVSSVISARSAAASPTSRASAWSSRRSSERAKSTDRTYPRVRAGQRRSVRLTTQHLEVVDNGSDRLTAYPATLTLDTPERIANWRPLVHWLLAIPHIVVLYVLGIVAEVVGAHQLAGHPVHREAARGAGRRAVHVPALLDPRPDVRRGSCVEEYPPFAFGTTAADPGDRAACAIDFQPALEDRNRVTVFFRLILAIPHFIVLAIVLGLGACRLPRHRRSSRCCSRAGGRRGCATFVVERAALEPAGAGLLLPAHRRVPAVHARLSCRATSTSLPSLPPACERARRRRRPRPSERPRARARAPRPLASERQDVALHAAGHVGLLLERPGPQRGAVDAGPLAHQLEQVDLGLGAGADADHRDAAARWRAPGGRRAGWARRRARGSRRRGRASTNASGAHDLAWRAERGDLGRARASARTVAVTWAPAARAELHGRRSRRRRRRRGCTPARRPGSPHCVNSASNAVLNTSGKPPASANGDAVGHRHAGGARGPPPARPAPPPPTTAITRSPTANRLAPGAERRPPRRPAPCRGCRPATPGGAG